MDFATGSSERMRAKRSSRPEGARTGAGFAADDAGLDSALAGGLGWGLPGKRRVRAGSCWAEINRGRREVKARRRGIDIDRFTTVRTLKKGMQFQNRKRGASCGWAIRQAEIEMLSFR